MNCFECTHIKNSILKDLSDENLKLFGDNKYTVSYRPGEVICKEGTIPAGLICLTKGKIKIVRRLINGNERIIGLKKAIDYIGIYALLGGTFSSSSYICLEDSSVCIVKKKIFFNAIRKNKKTVLEILKRLAKDVINKEIQTTNLIQKHGRARIAEALLLINNVFGANNETGYLNTTMRRSELAELANMTTNNAIRELSSLKREKLIDADGRNIKINDLTGLKAISEFDL